MSTIDSEEYSKGYGLGPRAMGYEAPQTYESEHMCELCVMLCRSAQYLISKVAGLSTVYSSLTGPSHTHNRPPLPLGAHWHHHLRAEQGAVFGHGHDVLRVANRTLHHVQAPKDSLKVSHDGTAQATIASIPSHINWAFPRIGIPAKCKKS